MLIDTHCHLDAFGADATQVLAAAQAVGVTHLIVPAVARNNFSAVLALCQKHPNCLPALGIHPLFAAEATADDLIALKEFIQSNQIVAIGEIGLDYFVAASSIEKQIYFLDQQLQLAEEFNLPVLLHCRRGYDTLLHHLRRYRLRGGIVHAFSGSRQQAEQFIQRGFKLGFGGAMTFPRARKIRQLAANLPLSSLVLETDAPDMRPAFLARGERNQPQFLPAIAAVLAELRGLTLVEIARASSENTLNVFSEKAWMRERF